MSFHRLIERFRNGLCGPEAEKKDQNPLPLATAAVLLDIAHADGNFAPAVDGDIVGYLERAFHLEGEAARELLKAAEETRAKTIDYFALTEFIRRNSSLTDRIEIVKTMWRMVYADGKLSDYENYLVRKLADLLGLEHHVMIDAKVSVLRELGVATA